MISLRDLFSTKINAYSDYYGDSTKLNTKYVRMTVEYLFTILRW